MANSGTVSSDIDFKVFFQYDVLKDFNLSLCCSSDVLSDHHYLDIILSAHTKLVSPAIEFVPICTRVVFHADFPCGPELPELIDNGSSLFGLFPDLLSDIVMP